MKKIASILAIIGLILIGCTLSSVNLSNATDEELDQACNALARVGYDYYRLDVLAVGGRILEVAASIHVDHSGPEETRKYCQKR